jgi:hypothetical protein
LAGTKVVGLILLILSIPLILLGILYLFSDVDAVPQIVPDDRNMSGYAAAGAGAVFLLLGVVLMLLTPKPKGVVVAPTAVAPPQQFEIKRTEMNWGTTSQAKTASEDLQDQMDAVKQKLSRIKVQYGMGELSSESYRTLTQQYELEMAAIERKVLDQQGH